MGKHTLRAFTLLGIYLFHQVNAQSPSPTALSLTEILTFTSNPPNEAVQAVFPDSMRRAQTPIAVRYALFAAVLHHEIFAACNPVILSFFGTKDYILREHCSVEGEIVIRSYIFYRVLASQFPDIGRTYGRFLISVGLTPLDQSRDTSTRLGWANVIADRLVYYFANDGWNSLGDATRDHYRQSFADSVGYVPQNPAFLPPDKLIRPLRWQPLTGSLDNRGNFGSQVHLLPQLGITAVPLTISKEELSERMVEAPYEMKDKVSDLTEADEETVLDLIDKLFGLSQNLTAKDVFLSYWWDDKFASLGAFPFLLTAMFNFSDTDIRRVTLGDAIAQYDAVILAWKEKLRHDLVRPPTIIRRLLRGKMVQAFKGFGKGIGLVSAEEWEPVIPIQPHSEFPSASAVICQATGDVLKAMVADITGNAAIPPFEFGVLSDRVTNSPFNVTFSVKFDTLDDAVRSCGNSRLLAGLHFAPSVSAGYELAAGLGERVAEHMADLFAGKVPRNCARCIAQ